MREVVLYFGSFNPIHRGHIALAEYALEKGIGDEAVLIVSPQNPLKKSDDLAPEMDRFEMAELACAASRFPERIKPSVVEFLLPKPSYTIETLRYLSLNHGSQMRFSILMGGDLVGQLDRWKEYRQIVDNYPVYVYPRRGEAVEIISDRMTLLCDAPLHDYSSSTVRDMLRRGEDVSAMLAPEVEKYIRDKGLWSPESRLAELTQLLDTEPERIDLLLERGKIRYRRNEWGEALNDFNCILQLDAAHTEAREYVRMVQEILAFRYKDIYNP